MVFKGFRPGRPVEAGSGTLGEIRVERAPPRQRARATAAAAGMLQRFSSRLPAEAASGT